jgi:predicted enzyme related to lactoylglutathione lyase
VAVRGLDEIVIDCRDPARLAAFWAAVFETQPVIRGDSWAYIESERTRTRIAFQRVPEPKSVKNRVHIDVDVDDISVECARLVALGAVKVADIVVDEQGPFQVMLDPERNEFCLVS